MPSPFINLTTFEGNPISVNTDRITTFMAVDDNRRGAIAQSTGRPFGGKTLIVLDGVQELYVLEDADDIDRRIDSLCEQVEA